VSGRRDEVILYYSHDQKLHTATFPLRLADGHWHSIALSLTDSRLTLRVNCSEVYERVVLPLDIKSLAGTSLQMNVGTRTSHGSHFRVSTKPGCRGDANTHV